MAVRSYSISRSSNATNSPAGSLSSRSVITGQQYSSVSERKSADTQARSVAQEALTTGQAPPQPSSGGIYTSSLPGSVRSPQAEALLQQAKQEKAVGNQQEAAFLERQAAEEQRRVTQKNYVEREAVFSQQSAVGQAEPGRLSAMSVLNTAGERRAAGEIRNIPFQQVEGVTQTVLPARDFSFVTSASPGFAGKAATIPELKVTTGIKAIGFNGKQFRPGGAVTTVEARSPEVFTQAPEVQNPQAVSASSFNKALFGDISPEAIIPKEAQVEAPEFKSVSERILQKSAESTGLKKLGLGAVGGVVGLVEPYVYLSREPFIKASPYKAYQEINANKATNLSNNITNTGKINHKVSSIVEGLKSYGKNLLFEETYSEYGSLEKIKEAPVQASSFLNARQAAERRLALNEKKFESSFGKPISEVYTEVKPVYEAARIKETGFGSERAEAFGQEAAFTTAGFVLAPTAIGSVSGLAGAIFPKAASSVSAKLVGTGLFLAAVETPNVIAESKEYGLQTALSASVGRVATYVTVFKGLEVASRVKVVEPAFKDSMYSFKFGEEIKGPAETSRYLFTSTKGKPIIGAEFNKPIETGPKKIDIRVKSVTPETGPRNFKELFKSRSTPEILEASRKNVLKSNELVYRDYSKSVDRITGRTGEVTKYRGIIPKSKNLPRPIKTDITPFKGDTGSVVETGGKGVYVPKPNEIIIKEPTEVIKDPIKEIEDKINKINEIPQEPKPPGIVTGLGFPSFGKHEPGFGGVPRYGRGGAFGGTKTYKVISPQAYRKLLTGSSKNYLKKVRRLY